ncbi:hypothetical protein AYR62_05865 [Secundilactobacillus paracollinoides]|uniref:segregation and condensation protein A n=1 Tax=Secundilactobacillus paracollinoides TaxID=240427 RepID=UPI00081A2CF2|nr:segregation/condensation protein A [Secundilactobacillus paracollinoides]ANZ63664.1 hypothetical protein AYR62_05865 [Secundilactobacillus paracollinoides]
MDNQPVIHIQNFEGPLDLLLHLIKSASIDIYDIPIVEITDQYMTALRQMEDHQLDVAGDYFVMAATLMKMKAKLLLPQQAEDDAEDDEPSLEEMQAALVEQLVTYQRYKEATKWFKQRQHDQQRFYTRPEADVPANVRLGKLKPGITFDQVQQALIDLMDKQREPAMPLRMIDGERYTVKAQMSKIRFRLQKTKVAISFKQFFDPKPNRDEVVTTFLALLEMTKQHEVTLDQPSRVLPITVKKANLGDAK